MCLTVATNFEEKNMDRIAKIIACVGLLSVSCVSPSLAMSDGDLAKLSSLAAERSVEVLARVPKELVGAHRGFIGVKPGYKEMDGCRETKVVDDTSKLTYVYFACGKHH